MNEKSSEKFSEFDKRQFIKKIRMNNQYKSDSQQVLQSTQFSNDFEVFKARLINVDEARQQDRKNKYKFPVDTDYRKGYILFQEQCGQCHALTKKDDKLLQGPFMGNIYGRIAGKMINKKYSDAYKALTFRWTKETLDSFLRQETQIKNQQIGKIKCQIDNKFQNIQNRVDLIQFLKKNTIQFNKYENIKK